MAWGPIPAGNRLGPGYGMRHGLSLRSTISFMGKGTGIQLDGNSAEVSA